MREVPVIKAIGSKVDIWAYDNSVAIEFNDCIADLLDLEVVKKLDQFDQHCGTSRLQHSLNVAYYSYLACKTMHLDYRSAARGGLLHDLFFYDWRDKNFNPRQHASWHPKLALRNAKKVCDLNKIEEDIILKHMWPVTITPPKYLESYIVTFADKYCATCEMGFQTYQDLRMKLNFAKS